MADQQQPGAITAAFPAPPTFYKHFTPQSQSRLNELVGSSEQTTLDTQSPKPSQILNLPPELRYLVPPPPPPHGKYRSFGESHDIFSPNPTLQDEGFPQLFPSPPSPSHLLTLTRSILLSYLSLINILATNPSAYGSEWDHLRDLFVNAHHLINEYRPHQARETLILGMEEQVERWRAETKGVREVGERIEIVLRSFQGLVLEVDEMDAAVRTGEKEKAMSEREKSGEEEKRVWQLVREVE